MPVYLLGVDVGTHSTKCLLVTLSGQVVARCVTQHDISRPNPGWAEHDAERIWWTEAAAVIARVLEDAAVNPAQVAAVGVSGLGPAVVPLDARGDPLRPAILYGIDARATAEIACLNEELGFDKSEAPLARRLQAQSLAPKVVWLREHEPEHWLRTRKLLGSTGYIVHRLTGEYVIDHANAEALEPLYDSAIGDWNTLMCDRIGVAKELLPEVHNATDVVGSVTERAAQETGLAVGTPVICGCMDGLAEYVSSGVVKADEGCVVFGSTMCVCVLTAEQVTHPLLYGGRTLLPGLSRLSGGMATSGVLLRWFRDQFAPEADLAFLDAEASAIAPGSDGLVILPYFSGERSPIFDAEARGLVLGLTVAHTRAHVYRALLEGVAYALRHHLELMAESGVVPRRLVALGGGSRSGVWTQIASDVIGHDLECVDQPFGAELADAFLAGFGIGVFADFSELAERWVRMGATLSPTPGARATYDAYYRVYRGLYNCTSDAMHELACLSA